MLYTILKNCHYSNYIPNIWYRKKFTKFNIKYNIEFNESCKYSIDEQSCVNKLFGFCFGLFGVHKNSIRFGWIYDNEQDKFFIYKYVYENGKLNKKIIFSTYYNIAHIYDISIYKALNGKCLIEFIIDNNIVLQEEYTGKLSNWIFGLGLYFGGQSKAPHKISINYKK